MNFTSFVICTIVVAVLMPIVDCEWSEEEFQRFERDLTELADNYLPFEAHPLTQSQHSLDNTGTLLIFDTTAGFYAGPS